MVDYILKDAIREAIHVSTYVCSNNYSRYVSLQTTSGGVFSELYSKDDRSCEWYKPLGSAKPIALGTLL